MRQIRAFTLIELLVVIAILGILSAVVLGSLNVSRAKARDAARRADIAELQKMVELYIDQYHTLPKPGTYGRANVSPGYWDGWWDLSSNPSGTGGQGFMQFLVDGGITRSVPVDPRNTPATNGVPISSNPGYRYVYYQVDSSYQYQGGSTSGMNVYLLAIARMETAQPAYVSPSCKELWKTAPGYFDSSFAYVVCGTY